MTPQQMIEWAEREAKIAEDNARAYQTANHTALFEVTINRAATARAVAEYIRRADRARIEALKALEAARPGEWVVPVEKSQPPIDPPDS
jgi:hypothetical protein